MKKILVLIMGILSMTGSVNGTEVVPYSPQEKWLLRYEDGTSESVVIHDGEQFHIPWRLCPIATLSQEIVSDREQIFQIGIGADWFWECRLNGRTVADFWTVGNQTTPIRKGNHIVQLPVKRGRNLLEIKVKAGFAGWRIAVGSLPLDYDVRQEALKDMLEIAKQPEDNCFQKLLPADFFQKIGNGTFSRDIYPPASDRNAWEAVRKHRNKQEAIRRIIAQADDVLLHDIPQLTFSEYRRYAIDGNRGAFEEKYFDRRNRLGVLVLALALTGQRERYLGKTIDYLHAILEEWTWCVPAHMRWDDRTRSPQEHFQCDIFASETAALLALTVNVIGCYLDEDYPALKSRIRNSVLARTVYNPLSIDTFHTNYWMLDEIPGNWTPWCCSNLITAALILEPDARKLTRIIQVYLKGVSRFIWHYTDDGYCMEGPSYYGVAAGNLYHLSRILERAVPGSMEKLYQTPKIRAIFEFIAGITVHDRMVSFGDACGDLALYRDSAMLKSCAFRIQSAKLQKLASGVLQCRPNIGNGSLLASSLTALFDIPENEAIPQAADENCSFFKDRLVVFRSALLSASMKAGSNAEFHNHNDLGHFSIWYGEKPLIVDAGAGVYTKKYFSAERYTLWNTRGKGHNAPVFDNMEQESGKQYTASLNLVPGQVGTAVCNLSRSYPEAVGVTGFTRTMRFAPDRIRIEDHFQLKQPRKTRIHLLCAVQPQIDGRRILFGEVALLLENLEYVSQGKIDAPDCPFTELVLEATAEQYRMEFSVLKKN